jgi:DNA ligase 1
MLLATVAEASLAIAETTKRLAKIDILSRLLEQLRPDEVGIVVAFLSGMTRQGRIGIGYATIRAAGAPAAGTASLEILDVDKTLEAIAATKGSGAEGRRRELLHDLMNRSTEREQRFLTALLIGELRQGALEGIMIEGVARASRVPASQVRRAVMMAGDVAPVATAVLAEGAAALDRYRVQLFRPVQPMLANTAEDAGSVISELGEAALEYKFDGARVQAHKSGDEVIVYSRRLNDVTPAIPEIVEAVRAMPAKELILDGEVLSLAPHGRPQPFQVTMRRFGRRLDVERMRKEQPVAPYWFDMLYLDGGEMIDEPQSRRFAALQQLSPVSAVVPHLITADSAKAGEFLDTALASGNEGIMAKAIDSPYEAGSRGQSWLKVKRARTLDLVILAAEWGNGRRQGWLSNLHLGARDLETGGYAMLGKTFKGLTDEMLAWQTQEFLKIEIARDKYAVYLEPKIVAEIAFNEIQVSPRYESGLALRFARVKRYRPDKSAADSDTFQTVKKLAGVAA